MGGGLWDRIPWWFVVGAFLLATVGAYFGAQALGYGTQGYLFFVGVVVIGGIVSFLNSLVR
jgi:hypothetical protein